MTDDRFDALGRLLSDAAASEREIQLEADADLRAEDLEMASAFLDERLQPVAEGKKPRRWIPWVTALAATLVCGWLLWRQPPGEPDQPVVLGNGAIEDPRPAGQVNAWSALSWRGSLPAGEQWTVIVESPASDGAWEELVRARTPDNEFALPAEFLAEPPEQIRWRVECLTIGASSGWVDSRLSSED